MESILCEFGQISAREIILLCCWNQFYAQTIIFLRQEMLLCSLNTFHASLDKSVAENAPVCTNRLQKLHFEFSHLNHSVYIKDLPWNITEAHGTESKGARLEKKADISA